MSKKYLDMTGYPVMNNSEEENTLLRDVFLECEREYFAKLKRDPSFIKMVCQLQKDFRADELNKMAIKTMEDIESCRVRPEDLDQYELFMICCVAAIVDLQKINEHIRLPDDDVLEIIRER